MCKHITKNSIKVTGLIIAILLFLQSCGEEDTITDPIDTEKPVITLVTPTTTSSKVWGTVVILAEATDNTGISALRIFIDGTLIKSSSGDSAEASWNSASVPDGAHELKVTAEDTDGNISDVTFNFTVMNNLFEIEVTDGFLKVFATDNWFFISDESGNTIDVQQIEGMGTYLIKTPLNYVEGTTYTLSQFLHNEFDNGGGHFTKYNTLTSFTGVTPGRYTFNRSQSSTQSSAGEHRLLVENFPIDTYFKSGAFGTNVTSSSLTIGYNYGFVANLSGSLSEVTYYIILDPPAVPKYLYLEEVAPGEVLTVDYSDFVDMDVYTTFQFPAGTIESGYQLSGFTSDYKQIKMGNYTNSYFDEDPTQLRLFTPQLIYPEYYTSVYHNRENALYFYGLTDVMPASDFKELDAQLKTFNQAQHTLTATFEGNFDRCSFSANMFKGYATYTVTDKWSIYLPNKEEISIRIPEIPLPLKEKYPELASEEFEFTEYDMVESTVWDGYADFILKVLDVPHSTTGRLETLSKSGEIY